MSKSFWRVEWDIDGGKGPRTSLEFGPEDKAMKWAEGLLKAGGKEIVVTEIIVGRTIHFNSDAPLFQK
jgi:hypothetical protein